MNNTSIQFPRKLYRYVPITGIDGVDKSTQLHHINKLLLDESQFGLDSILNRYLYLNKPEKFNDPFDCKFGISKSTAMKYLQKLLFNDELICQTLDFFQQDFDNMSYEEIHYNIVNSQIPVTFKKAILNMLEQLHVDNDLTKENEHKMRQNFIKPLVINIDFIKELINPKFASNVHLSKTVDFMNLVVSSIIESNYSFESIDIQNISLDNLEDLANIVGKTQEFKKTETEFIDKINELNHKIFAYLNSKIGVVSLTENFNDVLMWSHYANKHNGIMIEYEIKKEHIPNDTILVKVSYSSERCGVSDQLINQHVTKDAKADLTTLDWFISGLSTKSIEWQQESEWRLIRFLKNDDRKIEYPRITSIYLGNSLSANVKEAIVGLLENQYLNDAINIYYMENDIEQYAINPIFIKLFGGKNV